MREGGIKVGREGVREGGREGGTEAGREGGTDGEKEGGRGERERDRERTTGELHQQAALKVKYSYHHTLT